MKSTEHKTLSVCVTFCDKDHQYIERLINQVKEHIKVPYDLIICDNRKDKTLDLSFKEYITFSCDDQMCFIPRKTSIQYMKSDYVWYIDADDEIVEDITEDLFSEQTDLISFKVIDSDGNYTGTWPTRDESVYNKTFSDITINNFSNHLIGPCLWNKFIKFKIFERIQDIPDFRCVCNEDNFISTYMLKFVKTVRLIDITPYKYNILHSDLRAEHVTLDQFKRLCIDSAKIYDIADTLFTKQELIDCNDWLCREHSCRALCHLIARSSLEDVQEEIALLTNEYSLEIVQNMIKRFMIY